MKGVLAWIKSNLLIVISTAVIVLSLPLGWFFSSRWNGQIRVEQEKRANDAYNKITKAKVNYVIPSLLPGEEPVSVSRAPNPYVTEFVKTQREQRLSQAGQIVGQVESFNRDGHTNMAPELLPVPVSAGAETRLKFEFLAKIAGDRQMGAESVYNDLLAGIGAGGPPDPVRMATTIEDVRQRESERMLAEAGAQQIGPAQQDGLRKLLMERRVAEVQRRAKEISVYADLASFDPQGFGPDTAQIPPRDRRDRGTTAAPTLNEVFGWNFDYWVVTDLLRAIDRANTDAGGTRANVENAPVKRIEKLSVKKLPITPAPETGAPGMLGEPLPEEPLSAEAKDPSVSVTGRVSTQAYDVVPARLTLIVDASRLPDIFKAFAETNLMTVLDVDVSDVDVWDELRKGYFYGGDAPVVRADIEVETVWLRSWTVPIMPESVRQALGIATPEDPGEAGGGG